MNLALVSQTQFYSKSNYNILNVKSYVQWGKYKMFIVLYNYKPNPVLKVIEGFLEGMP